MEKRERFPTLCLRGVVSLENCVCLLEMNQFVIRRQGKVEGVLLAGRIVAVRGASLGNTGSGRGKGRRSFTWLSESPIKQQQVMVFLHGFLSSSSLWVESVFLNLSEDTNFRARMFAVDLLGFGNSPKPSNCLYTIEDHLEMIERTVIRQFHLESFHIVAHSMGCILALALAVKHPKSVKSITLVAPPYMPSIEGKARHNALNILAERKIWPPFLFGSSVMSWYEHLGRTICFILCRNHSIWEWIMKLLTRKKHLPFTVTDFTNHTHHSAWNTMHNVICGGAKLQDKYIEALREEGILLKIIQGTEDHVVPLECSHNMKAKVPQAELQLITGADHISAILGRKKAFTRDLEKTWSSTQSLKHFEHSPAIFQTSCC